MFLINLFSRCRSRFRNLVALLRSGRSKKGLRSGSQPDCSSGFQISLKIRLILYLVMSWHCYVFVLLSIYVVMSLRCFVLLLLLCCYGLRLSDFFHFSFPRLWSWTITPTSSRFCTSASKMLFSTKRLTSSSASGWDSTSCTSQCWRAFWWGN